MTGREFGFRMWRESRGRSEEGEDRRVLGPGPGRSPPPPPAGVLSALGASRGRGESRLGAAARGGGSPGPSRPPGPSGCLGLRGLLGQAARGPVGPGASVLCLWTRLAASPGPLVSWAPRRAGGLMVSSRENALQ